MEGDGGAGHEPKEKQIAPELMQQAKPEGVNSVGPGGFLSGLTKTVLETALEAELTEDLGYEPHEAVAATAGTRVRGPGPRRC